MGKRKTSRKLAMQALYQFEIQKDNLDFILEYTLAKDTYVDDTKKFATKIYYGVADNQDYIDKLITEFAIDWKFNRIAGIDKSILRVAIWELLFTENEIKIIIAESIDLVKKYSMHEAIKFINGILGRVAAKREELTPEEED